MDLHRADERPEEEYAALRAVLDDVPQPERHLRWRMIDILLDVHFRQNGARVIRRLTRLREVLESRGKSDRYERLWARVQALLGELTVTAHGYSPRLALRPADELWSQVGGVLDSLHAFGYQAFVNSGTLLGLVRGDGIVAHDDDVDLAVLLHAEETEAAAYEWLELCGSLREAGLLDLASDRPRTVHTSAASPDGLKLDLFPGWVSDDRLYLFPYCFGEVAADDVVPLKPIAVDGSARVLGPARPEALLAVNYGDDWRTPDPLFAFDWVSAQQRFSRFRGIVRNEHVVD